MKRFSAIVFLFTLVVFAMPVWAAPAATAKFSDIITRSPVIDTRSFTGQSYLSATTFAAQSSTLKKVILTNNFVVDGTVTVEVNVATEVIAGAKFVKGTAGKIVFRGPFICPLTQQAFEGFSPGDITFEKGSVAEVSPLWWGGNNRNIDDTQTAISIQSAFTSNVHRIVFPEGDYRMGNTNATYSATSGEKAGISVVGLGTYRTTRIIYTGAGYAFNFIGDGTEGTSPLTRFFMENLWFDGEGNTTSDGGVNIQRSYIVDLNRVQISKFEKDGAIQLNVRNTFNFIFRNGQISGSYPAAGGGYGVVIGSDTPNEWNTSNVQIVNSLIQRNKYYGLLILQAANVFDNLLLDNVSIGNNGLGGKGPLVSNGTAVGGSIFSDSPNINNIEIRNIHFESAGYDYSNPGIIALRTHLDLRNCRNVRIANNSFQDANTHINLEDVQDFTIENNKIYETGNYSNLTAATAIKIARVDGVSNGRMGQNTIYFDNIETPYNIDSSSYVDTGYINADEAQWSGLYYPNPMIWRGSTVVRRGVNTDHAYPYFNQMYVTPDGVNWLRYVLSGKRYEEATAMPSSGAYNIGDFVRKIDTSAVSGSAGSRYIVFGWYRLTTGSSHVANTDWVEVRTLTGQ